MLWVYSRHCRSRGRWDILHEAFITRSPFEQTELWQDAFSGCEQSCSSSDCSKLRMWMWMWIRLLLGLQLQLCLNLRCFFFYVSLLLLRLAEESLSNHTGFESTVRIRCDRMCCQDTPQLGNTAASIQHLSSTAMSIHCAHTHAHTNPACLNSSSLSEPSSAAVSYSLITQCSELL